MAKQMHSPKGYWNEVRCREVAMGCKSIEEFREAYEGRAYVNSRKRGQVKSLMREMYDKGYWNLPNRKPNGYWTLERCRDVCKNYDSQAELIRDHRDVYSAIKEHGWQKECFVPMKGMKKPNGYWTLEKCMQEASKYDSPADMKRGNPKAYSAMKSHGWYELCCAEMKNRRVPNNFWNEERIIDVMLMTKTRTEFQDNYGGAYSAAIALGIYEQQTKMMVDQGFWKEKNTKRRKRTCPDQKWTDQMAIDRARDYESLYEFRTKDPTAYHALVVRGLLELACGHMQRKHMPKGYWNKERVMEKVNASESLKDFKKRFNAAYQAAQVNGWLKDVVDVLGYAPKESSKKHSNCHFNSKRRAETEGKESKKKGTSTSTLMRWTVEKAKAVIATCKDYHDFREKYKGCWNFLCHRNLLEELTSHLERKGDLYHRRIYVFEFTDGHAYVGLSKDPEERYKKHTQSEEKSAVFQYLQKTGCEFEFKLLTDWLDKDEASHAEEFWRQQYIKDGWQMLNRVRCGALGGWHGIAHSLEECQKEAGKYKTRKEFSRKNPGLYAYSAKHYGLDVVCPHMPKNACIKWPIERIESEISKYGTMPEIKIKNPHLLAESII